MRLAAIFHCWDDWYLLRHSVDNIRPLVDGIIIIGSTKSNWGEHSEIPKEWHNNELYVREPHFNIPIHSETDKRNYGLEIARKQGYTHFITMDADEFYKPEEFLKVKEMFHVDPTLQGIVCPLEVFFGSPHLTLGRDITLVPHIHVLTPTIRHTFNKFYPFSWSGKQIRIDPSRSLNINTGVEYRDDITMYHYSWVRKDYQKKIRNSTARKNLERSNILTEVMQAKAGDFIHFYQKLLVPATVDFGIDDKIFSSPLCKDI